VKLLTTTELIKNKDQIDELTSSYYPEFILHDQITTTYWDKIYDLYPQFQLAYSKDHKIIAVGNSVPLNIENYNNFNIDGWDWALEQSIFQYNNQIKPNVLVGLSVVIDNEHQGKGKSKVVLSDFKKIAIQSGFDRVIIPIRPINKHLYPLMNLEDYINQRINGLHIDPWIRTHENLGGKIICICKNAMNISGTIKEWEDWSGIKLLNDGKYHIQGSLAPLEVDIAKNYCIYNEPNIWIEYILNN